MKIILILFLVAICVSLFTGLFFLMKDEGKSRRTANALTWRVGLQIGLIIVLIVAFFMGWLRPHDVYPDQSGNGTAQTQEQVSGERGKN